MPSAAARLMFTAAARRHGGWAVVTSCRLRWSRPGMASRRLTKVGDQLPAHYWGVKWMRTLPSSPVERLNWPVRLTGAEAVALAAGWAPA